VGADSQFDRLFDDFSDEAFRLETLPGYNVGADAERLRQFLSGAYLPEHPIPGVDFVREMVKPDRRTTLVRLVSKPITVDQRLSIDWVYPHHAEAGRAISILDPGSAAAERAAAVGDFWLFDAATVALMKYTPDGSFGGVEIISSQDEVNRFVDLRLELLAAAKPFASWLADWRREAL
jgi:hypothetical protein